VTGSARWFVHMLGASSVVHQATGMISVQLGGTLVEAADRLAAEAATSGRTVEDIAADVVARKTTFA